MRELSGVPLPNDHLTVWVPAEQWTCPLCHPGGGDGAYTSVVWLYQTDGPDGRCSRCGLKLRLAEANEHVPSVDEQLRRVIESRPKEGE